MKMPKAFAPVKGELTVVLPTERFVELKAEAGSVEAFKKLPRNDIKLANV
jgi:hypothetical protein